MIKNWLLGKLGLVSESCYANLISENNSLRNKVQELETRLFSLECPTFKKLLEKYGSSKISDFNYHIQRKIAYRVLRRQFPGNQQIFYRHTYDCESIAFSCGKTTGFIPLSYTIEKLVESMNTSIQANIRARAEIKKRKRG